MPAPTISSVSPGSGNYGDVVILSGSNFDPTAGNNTVSFNGVTTTPALVLGGGTQIAVVIPSQATSGLISVTNGGGSGISPASFTVNSSHVSSLSPTSGAVGSSVTISGTGFDTTPGHNTVTFNGTAASVVSGSATSLVVTVPLGATSGPVSVRTAAGTGSSSSFTVVGPAPSITTFSPTSGVVGTLVTITGTNFGPDVSSNVVEVGGVSASIVQASTTQIQIVIPQAAVSGTLQVTTSGQSGSSAGSFSVLPLVTSVSPGSGPVGTQATVSGSGFSPTPGSNSVSFGGSAATSSSATPNSLTVTVPGGAVSGAVTVTTPVGSAGAPSGFTVTSTTVSGAPTLHSFDPTSGPAGTVVIVEGSNFDPVAGNNSVTVNGVLATVTEATSVELVITIPSGAMTGPIEIVNSGGSVISTTEFVVTAALGVGVDGFLGAEDDEVLSPAGLLPYLRAMLKDTASDLQELGLSEPSWADAELYRYLELARGEYSRQRPKRARTIVKTVANQQFYSAPPGSVGVDAVLWNPAGYDLDQISALAAALAGGPGLLWGGGVPVVGRVYFDSPASIQVWSIIRESWRRTFGGTFIPDTGGYLLSPTPTQDGLLVVVMYRSEQHWRDIPWQHRMFILVQAVVLAVESLTYQIVAAAPAQGQKLNLGLRALVQLVQIKYQQALNIREPGVTAGRS